jgi:nucleoside-diphosphate-sugar epimerase
MNTIKRVLISGGSGFLGRNCIPRLLDRGYEVHAVLHRGMPDTDDHKNLFFHRCDLMNFQEQKRIFSDIRPTHLLHLAWYAEPGKYWTSTENYRWVQASLEMIMNFTGNGGRRIVCAGSSAEYDWSEGHCTERLTPLRPSSPYGTCKNSLHDMLVQISRQESVSYAWGRLFFVYGPHENPERLVSSVIISLLKNREAGCLNPGLIRDFLYIKDAADAFVSLLDSHVTGPVNIASGTPVSIRDIVTGIANKMGKTDLIRMNEDNPPINEPGSLTADVERLRHEVGWTPGYDLDRGLDETIDWWSRHNFDSLNSKG